PSLPSRSAPSALVRRSSKPSSGWAWRSRRVATNCSRSIGGRCAVIGCSRERGAGSGSVRCRKGTAPRSLLPFSSHSRTRAQSIHHAYLVFRPPRDAHAAPVKDQVVREPAPLVALHDRHLVALAHDGICLF